MRRFGLSIPLQSQRSFATEFDRLQPRPDLLRIGVNIRVGDWAFDPAIEREKLHNLSYYHNYFNCAQSIEGFSRHQQHSQVSVEVVVVVEVIVDVVVVDVVVVGRVPLLFACFVWHIMRAAISL